MSKFFFDLLFLIVNIIAYIRTYKTPVKIREDLEFILLGSKLKQGRPYMESIVENRSLLYSLSGAFLFLLALLFDYMPDVNDQFEIVHFTNEVSVWLVKFLKYLNLLYLSTL